MIYARARVRLRCARDSSRLARGVGAFSPVADSVVLVRCSPAREFLAVSSGGWLHHGSIVFVGARDGVLDSISPRFVPSKLAAGVEHHRRTRADYFRGLDFLARETGSGCRETGREDGTIRGRRGGPQRHLRAHSPPALRRLAHRDSGRLLSCWDTSDVDSRCGLVRVDPAGYCNGGA